MIHLVLGSDPHMSLDPVDVVSTGITLVSRDHSSDCSVSDNKIVC